MGQENATSSRALLATVPAEAVLANRTDTVVADEAAMAAALVGTPFSLGYANSLTIATWELTPARMVNAAGWATTLGPESVQAAVQGSGWSLATTSHNLSAAELGPDPGSIRVGAAPPLPVLGGGNLNTSTVPVASLNVSTFNNSTGSRAAWPAVFIRYGLTQVLASLLLSSLNLV